MARISKMTKGASTVGLHGRYAKTGGNMRSKRMKAPQGGRSPMNSVKGGSRVTDCGC